MNVSDPGRIRPDDEIADDHAVSDGGARSEAAPVVVDVQGVEKVFDTDRGRLTALRGIDLSIREGEFISLIGPSGCGKSTLLRLIGDLTSPSTGTILVNGTPARAARLGREYGMVFQAPVLMDWRTVQRNVELPLEIMGYSRAERERKARAMLELVELADFDRVHPWQLSGGMQQRVAIARALAFDPKLLLMDEPFGALDEMTRERMNLELMNIWRRTGITIIFVTHSIPEAVFLSSRVVVMSARPGRITRIVDVDLPHPRTVDTRELERYFELVTSVREALRRHEADADGGSGEDGARIRAEGLA
jgi:NitT/TauT family transport system ATP-binding protein